MGGGRQRSQTREVGLGWCPVITFNPARIGKIQSTEAAWDTRASFGIPAFALYIQ